MRKQAWLPHDGRFGTNGPRRAAGVILAALVWVTAASLGTTALAADRTDYVIKAGVIDGSGPTLDSLRETHEVTMDPSRRPGWCFVVDPPSTDPYEVYSVHHLPGTPKSLTGDFAGTQPDTAMAGLKTSVQHVEGTRTFCSDFHAGDPLGEYRVEVFINGALTATLRLQVVEPPAEVNEGDK